MVHDEDGSLQLPFISYAHSSAQAQSVKNYWTLRRNFRPGESPAPTIGKPGRILRGSSTDSGGSTSEL